MVSLEPGVGGLKWDLPSPTVRCFIGTPTVARSISMGKVSIEWLQHKDQIYHFGPQTHGDSI